MILDVREQQEYEQGHIPGAVHVPRGHLETRIESAVPDRSRRVIAYCSTQNRSALAANTMKELLGYEDVAVDDRRLHALEATAATRSSSRRSLTAEQKERYSRHLLIPEVGIEGQQKLLDAKVLLIGAGGLGSPAALYLAAAGVGTLGIVDDDEVDLTQPPAPGDPQHRAHRRAEGRVGAADDRGAQPGRRGGAATRPGSNADNVLDLIRDYDVIVDGADNFPTRYLLNDAAVRERKPVVHASILGFDGQLTVFVPYEGPCYRCLYPQPPPADLAPSCGANGVLGVLPGHHGPAPGERGDQADHRRRASRWSGGCCCSRRSRRSSRSCGSAATPRAARSAATASTSRTPSSRTTRRSARRPASAGADR